MKIKKISLGSIIVESFDVFGIVTHFKPHILAHHINNKLNYSLLRMPDFEITAERAYPIFEYTIPENENKVYLILNKSSYPLVQEQKEITYWLLVKGDWTISDTPSFVKNLRSISGITYVFHQVSDACSFLKNHPLQYI